MISPEHAVFWLQTWRIEPTQGNTVGMHLASHTFNGNPGVYEPERRFVLVEGGMDQTLTVTHTGSRPCH